MSANLFGMTPPHDLLAEQAVLGAILVHPELFSQLAMIVDGEDLYSEKHRLIFAALYRLHAEGTEIDELSVADALRTTGDW